MFLTKMEQNLCRTFLGRQNGTAVCRFVGQVSIMQEKYSSNVQNLKKNSFFLEVSKIMRIFADENLKP